MDLCSCDECGIVIDKDKISFPDIEKEDGTIDTDKAIWWWHRYVPYIPCPVCDSPIRQNQ